MGDHNTAAHRLSGRMLVPGPRGNQETWERGCSATPAQTVAPLHALWMASSAGTTRVLGLCKYPGTYPSTQRGPWRPTIKRHRQRLDILNPLPVSAQPAFMHVRDMTDFSLWRRTRWPCCRLCDGRISWQNCTCNFANDRHIRHIVDLQSVVAASDSSKPALRASL